MDASRHLTIFDPDKWGNKRVDVIGCGAVGSRIAVELARLGVTNLHLWDMDIVEEANIANQIWFINDIGDEKTVATARHCKAISGTLPTIHGKATGEDQYGNVVFLLTDTVPSRKDIFLGALRFNNQVEWLIETRMGSIDGRIYSFNPNQITHCSNWWKYLPADDAPAEVSLCGTNISIGPTAAAITGYAVWSFMQFARHQVFPNELIIGMSVPSFISNSWPVYS